MATATGRRAFRHQVAAVQAREQQLTSSEGYLAAASPRAVTVLLGRSRGLPPGQVTAPAAGNSSITSDTRGQAAAQPGKGAGTGPANTSPYPARAVLTPPDQVGARAYGGPAYQNGRLIAYDRHITASRGRTASSSAQQQTGGTPNPEAAGPARPSHRMVNRVLSWQQGAGWTRGLDNDAFHAATSAGSRAFPLGTQGDPWSIKPGGTPGLSAFRPYGHRGGFSGGAPAPRVIAAPGGPYRPGTVLSAGDPGDGPQKVSGGYPHGLHSATAAPARVTGAVQRARLAQLRVPFPLRPANSRIAGQSYDQQVVHLDGSRAVAVPRISGGRQPGVNARWRQP